jgi:transcriptional regulator with XRE-family HTH domain
MTKKKELKISEVLPRLLEKRGLSLRELSRQTGIPQRTVAEWAKPGSKPSDVTAIKKCADLLQVSTDFLLWGEDSNPVNFESLPTDVILEGLYRIKLEKIKIGGK